MAPTSRLNVLLTYPPSRVQYRHGILEWPEMVSRMLEPMQVKTFVATSGHQALDLVEHHAMHVAVLDAGLAGENEGSGLGAMTVMRLIRRLGAGGHRTIMDVNIGDPPPHRWHQPDVERAANTGRRIPVTGPSGKPAAPNQNQPEITGPLVILLAPPGSDQLMHEALEWNVFSIVPEPLDVNGLLTVMARALERFYDNHWPT
ncbi:MAG: hypothetical protein HKL95_04255 [Phycisphaerae bacterium]|nr:hypothetical protein [Phycisphaerae bacterium]